MSNRPTDCEAYQIGDQWFCDRCTLVWDVNDEDPPVCIQHNHKLSVSEEIQKIHEILENNDG